MVKHGIFSRLLVLWFSPGRCCITSCPPTRSWNICIDVHIYIYNISVSALRGSPPFSSFDLSGLATAGGFNLFTAFHVELRCTSLGRFSIRGLLLVGGQPLKPRLFSGSVQAAKDFVVELVLDFVTSGTSPCSCTHCLIQFGYFLYCLLVI